MNLRKKIIICNNHYDAFSSQEYLFNNTDVRWIVREKDKIDKDNNILNFYTFPIYLIINEDNKLLWLNPNIQVSFNVVIKDFVKITPKILFRRAKLNKINGDRF